MKPGRVHAHGEFSRSRSTARCARCWITCRPPGLELAQLAGRRARARDARARAAAIGVIVAHAEQSRLAPDRLRPIRELLDREPLFTPELLELLQWTATLLPPRSRRGVRRGASGGAARRPAGAGTADLGRPHRRGPGGGRATVCRARAPRQRELLTLLAAHAAGISADELDATHGRLAQRGARAQAARLARIRRARSGRGSAAARRRQRAAARADARTDRARSPQAVATIDAAAHSYGAFLLQGVTGSGKTEVYLRLVQRERSSAGAARWCWCRRSASRRSCSSASARASPVPIAVLHSGLERRRAARELAQRARRPRAGRDRHALGGLRAAPGTRADRRRRGTRQLLQAARRRLSLFGARSGGAPRAAGRRAGAAGLGDTGARIAPQRRTAAATGNCRCRGAPTRAPRRAWR